MYVCIHTYTHTYIHHTFIHTVEKKNSLRIKILWKTKQWKKCQQTFRGCRDRQIYWITGAHALQASFFLVPALRKRICLSCARKRGGEGARDEVRTSLRDNTRSNKTRVWLETCGIGLQCTLKISQPELFVPFLLDPIRTRRHLKDKSSSLTQKPCKPRKKKLLGKIKSPCARQGCRGTWPSRAVAHFFLKFFFQTKALAEEPQRCHVLKI